MARKRRPVVAICGRPNVGKSTLYNRLTGKQRAIIHDLEGITRDRRYGRVTWNGHVFDVVDTGGVVESPEDPVIQQMQAQVRRALDEAAAIVFVIDGQTALTRIDLELRDLLFKLGKPVVLAVNKLDNEQLAMNRHEFYELGLGEPIAISSGHNLGIDALLKAVTEHLPEPAPEAEGGEEDTGEDEVPDVPAGPIRVAIVGKPNVGKSSFINAILNEERAIVDNRPGTTRDSIDVEFNWQGREYLLIDTAGLRKKAGIKAPVEHFSVTRSLRAIRAADVCLVMVDATDGITEQDKRVFGFVLEQGTPIILVWTKWDLIEDRDRRFKELREELEFKMPQLRHAPFVTVSNVERTRIYKVFEYVDRIAEKSRTRISTADFNKFLADVREKHRPSSSQGKEAKILYGTQTSVRPATFVLFVNQKRLFHFSYLRFLENRIREHYGFEGIPIVLELREEENRK
jgi:GTPase